MKGDRIDGAVAADAEPVLRVLGPVTLGAAGATVDVGPSKQRTLLAVLAVDAGRPVSTDALITRIWGDEPPPSARDSLYVLVARLRRVLSEAGLADRASVQRRAGGYVLRIPAAGVDLGLFRSLRDRAGDHDLAEPERAELLSRALDFWAGPPLSGVSGSWAEQVRAGLAVEALEVLVAWGRLEVSLGHAEAVVGRVRTAIEAFPLVEPLVGVQMLALHGSGRDSEAVECYVAARARLAEELGIEPGRELQEVYAKLLRDELDGPAGTGPDDSWTHRAERSIVPRELPTPVATFTGRAEELASLHRWLDDSDAEENGVPTMVISAVSGAAGVGKTALAVLWAHQVSARFPDGQLYVNLRGYDPDQPMTSGDALTRLLAGQGVVGQDVPADPGERAGRYRTATAGRRLLIVLDNASSAEQVRPLLPGDGSSVVVVTSRDSLAGLVVRDGARRLDLDPLPAADAVELLRRLIGPRVETEPDAAVRLAGQCARLPLALRVAAELALTRPANSLGELVAELDVEAGTGLTELHRAMLRQDPGLEGRIEAQLNAGPHAAPNPPVAPTLAAPHHLPLDIPDFTGRHEPIEAMREQLTAGRAVIVVTGEAGVGKTSLVVHLAHRLVELFPDGQLFVALAGSGSRPATAQEALTRILVLLGVDRTAIPAETTLRTELFRAVLARRRVLLVLDNAADEAQVRPLLPWGTGSALIVTSRRALTGLEPACHLVLPELSGVESIELLANIAGTARVAAEPDAATRIAQLCDRLPLAIRIAGARLAAKPHWALRELVERLTDEHRRLDELQVGDLAVRASLSLTYQVLQPDTRQLFRILGQLTGADFPAWVAATLVGSPVTEVTEGLEQLVDWHLLDVAQRDAAGRQRYRMHDLLAVFARELQRDAVEEGERHTAMGQALGAWLTVFDGMEARLVREARSYDRHRPPASYPLGWLPPQRSAVSGATAETTAETSTLIIETGWAVTATLVGMSFELWSQWDNWRMTRAVALYAGRRAGDRLIAQTWEIKPGQEQPWSAAVTTLEQCVRSFHDLEELNWHAVSLLSLGNLYRAGARLDASGQTLHACVERFRALGHPDWTGAALLSLGSLGVVDGRLAEAETSLRDCLDIFAERGDRLWQGYARRALGYAYQQHGRFAEAVAELEAALPVFREHEDSMWEAHTSLTLGLARLGLHQLAHAVDELERSVATFRYYGDPRSEALALRALARAEIGRNRVDAAETHLHASLAVFTGLENTVGTPLALWDVGMLYQRTGRSAEADTYLAPARQIFTELKLTELPSLAR